MKTTTTFIKTKLFFVLLILFPAALFIYTGCHKDDNQPASCGDGIQNQGETGVDCGGPCAACATTLCNGNGQNFFMPLANNNYWKYEDQGVSSANYTFTINGTQVFGPNTYYNIGYCNLPPSCAPSDNYYIRIAGNGDVYQYFPNLSAEYLLIPANPALSQTWAFPVDTAIGTRKVMSINESVTTYACTYAECVKIEEYTSANSPWKIYHYKKGLGLVFENAGTANYRLVQITLH